MSKNDDLIEEIRTNFDEALTAWDTVFTDALNDLEFVNGDQWPSDLKKERDADGRPSLVINKLAVFGDQVCGDIRQNEPSIKVKPVDSESDPDVAEILTGLIRNIEVQSNAEVAYDTAAESAVWCGLGAFRVLTEYADDDTFDQDIRIRRIKNPFTVFWDPASQEWDRSDARYVFITERIPREEFKRLYPNAAITDADGGKDKDPTWSGDKSIRVAEYFYKRTSKKSKYFMKDPLTGTEQTSDEKLDNWDVVKSRSIKSSKIWWCKTNGKEILEGPTEWPGKYLPIVGVFGKELNIEGKSIYRGIIRHAKDPQRLYNYNRSHGAEVTSLAPKAPYLVTAKMISNYQTIWNSSHKKTYPYLPFELDPGNPNMAPQRAAPIVQNTAIISEIQISDQEMHDTTGLQQASLGKKSNEQSGRAIMARQREGDVANYAFYDNLGRALTYCGKVLIDLIQKIYDTERVVRVIGEDGSDQFVPVNQPVTNAKTGVEKVFDLTAGKYDVVVTIGPSYSTQREEAADMMMAFLKAVPAAGPLVADLIAKNMDWPGAQEIEKRLKALLPPGLSDGQGSPPPSPPQPPDPIALKAQADLEGQLIDNRMKRVQAARAEMGIDQGEGETTTRQ